MIIPPASVTGTLPSSDSALKIPVFISLHRGEITKLASIHEENRLPLDKQNLEFAQAVVRREVPGSFTGKIRAVFVRRPDETWDDLILMQVNYSKKG
ncbi:MAG: hypothetical protein HUU10_04175 [Bacteroidetes bacterium]|nr:hypothetical protein [Bacteroidota bacterium]